jgi:multimeric flavodoxin WrbA
MKLMAFIGSPRKSSNTEILVDQVIAGCKSNVDVDAEKVFVVRKKIEYCTGCMTCCFPPPGTGKCVLKDDMAEILESMKESDIFIFGSPNHMGTISAPLLNFLSRMMPLFDFTIEYDDKGNMIGGEMSSKIRGKKAAIVISQGDPFFSSSLVYMVLEKNLNDFRLIRIGDVISRANLEEKSVLKKEEDLKKAFDLGVQLSTWSGMK